MPMLAREASLYSNICSNTIGPMHTPSRGIPPSQSGQPERRDGSEPGSTGLLKAMSPGVVDFLFRQMVAGRPAEDVQWEQEGISLSTQPEGAELARRLAETDVDALTPLELFHYARAAQRLATWAEDLRHKAVGKYCGTPPA
jgi:hypothetical protein